MPIELKEGFNTSKYVRRAAERRAADEDHTQFSQGELQRRTKAILALGSLSSTFPPLAPGQVFDAIAWSDYLRNAKTNMGIVASIGGGLEEEIQLSSRRNFALLDDLQREAQALDSYVTEEEIKINGRYSQVHYNSFIRPRDANLSYEDLSWITDYKTGLPFQANNISNVIQGTGMTLPLRQEIPIPIIDVTLVGEETDVGDTVRPIVSNEPKNLLRDERVFRHVIIRTDHDKTSRKYNHTPSYCTLLLEFASIQLVNVLNIRPLGHSTVYVESITYLNEVGEEVELTEVELSSEVELTVLFEPIRTRFLKVKLRQYAPVTRTHFDAADLRVRELNRLLRGAGFSQLLDEKSQEIMGRVYDFSMESVRCGLRTYENLGVFRSQPISVKGPMGVSCSDTIETIQINDDARTYGTQFFLNEGEVLLERYLGVDLHWKEGGRAFRDLIPIPDARSVQREFLPIFSGECQVKLFPDLTWNLNKIKWTSAVWLLGYLWIHFENGHGIDRDFIAKNTDRIVCIGGPGRQGNTFNFVSDEWYVSSDTGLILRPTDITGLLSGSSGQFKIAPFVYLEDDQNNPLTVYKEDEAIAFGTDYQISLDRGATWLSDWPRDARWHTLRSQAQAGKFKIKILNPDSTKLYWCEYKALRNQQLSKRKGVNLRRGRVVFDKRFKQASGTISTVIVSRADSVNPYLTPVLSSYFLRVREHVS